MKRDMDLVRQILLAIEESSGAMQRTPPIEGYAEGVVGFHCYLLKQAGFIEADLYDLQGLVPRATPRNLTWAGYDFLDALRDQARWTEAKAAVAKGGLPSFEDVKNLLAQMARKTVAGPKPLGPPPPHA